MEWKASSRIIKFVLELSRDFVVFCFDIMGAEMAAALSDDKIVKNPKPDDEPCAWVWVG